MSEITPSEFIVDGEWLQAHLADANLRIVDCDARVAYGRAHIPGAVWPPSHPYKNPDSPLHVMEPEQFAAAMSALGIGNDTLVVAYDTAGTSASRFWWCLNYFGHKHVRILDGGWQRWLHEGRPVSMAEPDVSPATFTPRVDESLLATADSVLASMSRPDVVILDVRSVAEWNGVRRPGNQRGGHIPGSVHLEWTASVTADDERCLKSPEELRAIFEAAGITPDKEVVTI